MPKTYPQEFREGALELVRQGRPVVEVARELGIADCVRRINLDFHIDDAEDRLNSFHKIDTLIAALCEFREGMAAEAALRRRMRETDRASVGADGDDRVFGHGRGVRSRSQVTS